MLEPMNDPEWGVDALTQKRHREEAQEEYSNSLTGREKIWAAVEENSVTSWADKQANQQELPADPTFKLTPELLNQYAEGIDDSYRKELFAAKSLPELQRIADTIKHSQANVEKAFSGGMMSGLSYSVLGSLMDPLGLAVGGVAGRTPAMFVKSYRTMNQARLAGAAAGAGASAGMVGYIADQSPTVGLEDVMWAAAFGGALGTFTHGLSPDDALRIKKSQAKIRDSFDDPKVPKDDGIPDDVNAPLAEGETPYWAKRPDESVKDFLARSSKESGRDQDSVYGATSNPVVRMFSQFFRSRRGEIEGSDNPLAKELLVKLASTSTGYKNAVDDIGAITRRDFFMEDANYGIVQSYSGAEDALTAHLGRKVTTDEVNDVLFDILNDGSTKYDAIPELTRHADRLRKMLDDINAEELGVGLGKGSKEFYFPRVWLPEQILKDTDAFKRLVVQSIGKHVPEDAATRIGTHMVKAITMIKSSRQSDLLDVLTGDSRRLDDVLTYGELTAEQIDAVKEFAKVLSREADTQSGMPAFRRKRLEFDLTQVDEVTGLTLRDFVDRDVSSVISNRLRKGKGRATLAHLGFPTESSFMKFVDEILTDADPKAVARQKAVFESIYDNLVGRPSRFTTTGPFSDIAETIVKMQTPIWMNMMGMSSFVEWGNVLGSVNVQNWAKAMPAFKDLKNGLIAGEVSGADAEMFLKIMGGYGKSRIQRKVQLRVDAETQGKMGAANRTAQKLSNVTADISGHSLVVAAQQHTFAAGFTLDFMQFAKTGKRSSSLSDARLRDAGLSKADVDTMTDLVRKHSTGDDLGDFGFEKWPEVMQDKFSHAVYAMGRRIVLEPNAVDRPIWADSLLYRALFQFMGHPMAAFEQTMMRNVKHKDMAAVRMTSASMFFGALTYMALVNMRSVGRDDRHLYLKENLTADKIGAAAIQRSSIASIMPNMADTGLWLAGMDPMFAYRSSSLGTSLVSSAPVVKLAQEAVPNTLKATIGLFKGEDLHRQDISAMRRLLFFQNAYGIQNALNYWQQSAPIKYE